MIADTTFVRANHVVVLDAVTHVGLYIAFVVGPGHTEGDDSVGDAKALNEVGALKLRVLVVLFFDSAQHLAHCLDVLWLIRESLLKILHNF